MKQYLVTVDGDKIISVVPYVAPENLPTEEDGQKSVLVSVEKEKPVYVDFENDCSDRHKNNLAVYHEALENLPHDRTGVTLGDVSAALTDAITTIGIRHGGRRLNYRTTVSDQTIRKLELANKDALDKLFFEYYISEDMSLKDTLLNHLVRGKEVGDEIMIEYAFEEFHRMYF